MRGGRQMEEAFDVSQMRMRTPENVLKRRKKGTDPKELRQKSFSRV